MLMKRGPKLLKHFETKKHAAKRVKVKKRILKKQIVWFDN